jgi:Spy/CpxP family protein refolding chaperone
MGTVAKFLYQPTERIMKRITKIALGVGTALTLGLGAAMVSAHPEGYGYGPGMGWGGQMGGYGPQGMMGYGHGYGPGMGWGPGHMGSYGPQGMMGYGYGNAAPGAAFEDRLAEMKTELKVTSKQESAWKAYADQVKAQAESMRAWHAAMWGAAPATAPERLAQRDAMLKQRLAQHEAMTSAFNDLYKVLTPEQRAMVDQGYLAMGPGPRGPGGRFR